MLRYGSVWLLGLKGVFLGLPGRGKRPKMIQSREENEIHEKRALRMVRVDLYLGELGSSRVGGETYMLELR